MIAGWDLFLMAGSYEAECQNCGAVVGGTPAAGWASFYVALTGHKCEKSVPAVPGCGNPRP